VANFTVSPSSPQVGQTVTLTSTSTDPDGDPITILGWDVKPGNQFNDGVPKNPTVTVTFAEAGNHTVGLQVEDSDHNGDDRFVTIAVKNPPPGSTPVTPAPGATPITTLRVLSPFPVVVIAGRTSNRGARLSRLTIKAPVGSLVTVFCHGRRCPYKRASHLSRNGRVRFPGLQRRLRAGTVIEVYITKRGSIGKYTRIRIRAHKKPARTDRCIVSTTFRFWPCPPR
jgi:hypothetical protein